MSDALTLAEEVAYGIFGVRYDDLDPRHQEQCDRTVERIKAARLAELAGDGETMERAVAEAVRVRQSRSGLPESFAALRHFTESAREYIEAAAPILRAPLLAEVERLKGDLFGQRNIADARKADLDKMQERLATAEARVRELEALLGRTP